MVAWRGAALRLDCPTRRLGPQDSDTAAGLRRRAVGRHEPACPSTHAAMPLRRAPESRGQSTCRNVDHISTPPGRSSRSRTSSSSRRSRNLSPSRRSHARRSNGPLNPTPPRHAPPLVSLVCRTGPDEPVAGAADMHVSSRGWGDVRQPTAREAGPAGVSPHLHPCTRSAATSPTAARPSGFRTSAILDIRACSSLRAQSRLAHSGPASRQAGARQAKPAR